MDKLYLAQQVAIAAHHGQKYGILPYTFHLDRVVEIAHSVNASEVIKIACYLHDTLEDTDLAYSDIKRYFGKEIADIVYLVTDEKGRRRIDRIRATYSKIAKNFEASIVKLCDRIANLEHSKEYNLSLHEMYKKEDSIFQTYLKYDHPSVVWSELWERYNDALKPY